MPSCSRSPAGSLKVSRAALGLLIYASSVAGPAAAAGHDPFTPGLAWSAVADAADPWIARSLCLAADDNLVWAAQGGSNPHLDLYSIHGPEHASASVLPLWRDDSVSTAAGTPIVAAARDASVLFSVAQLPAPTPTLRRTVVAGHDPLRSVPLWTYDMGVLSNGPARLACDARGELAVVALWIQSTSTVQIDWLAGSSGVQLARVVIAAASLSQIVVSADGARTLVTAGLGLWVFDRTGVLVHNEMLAAATPAIAISADGGTVSVGGIGRLRVLASGTPGYVLAREIAGGGDELAVRSALSDDGRTLAIGWWRYTNGVDLRFEVWDLALGVRRFAQAQHGTPGGLQNLPEAVLVTPDGRRAAFGCWGDGTNSPEVLLVDVASGETRLSIDLAGSVHALALDAEGTRVAVAMKHTHANLLGSTGEIRLYDSGERDLVVFGQAYVGGTLELAAQHPGASLCVFLYGLPSSAPITFPGTEGELWLKRARLIVIPVVPDANRRADLSIPIPSDPALIGREWHLQAAFRVNGTLVFGRSLVDPLLL